MRTDTRGQPVKGCRCALAANAGILIKYIHMKAIERLDLESCLNGATSPDDRGRY